MKKFKQFKKKALKMKRKKQKDAFTVPSIRLKMKDVQKIQNKKVFLTLTH